MIEPIKITSKDLVKLTGDDFVELSLDVQKLVDKVQGEVTGCYFYDKDFNTIKFPKEELSSAMMSLRCRVLNQNRDPFYVTVGVDYIKDSDALSKDLFISGKYVKESNWR